MSVKPGNAVLRVSLNKNLIRHLKKVAIDAGVDPCVLVEAALKNHLFPESSGDFANTLPEPSPKPTPTATPEYPRHQSVNGVRLS